MKTETICRRSSQESIVKNATVKSHILFIATTVPWKMGIDILGIMLISSNAAEIGAAFTGLARPPTRLASASTVMMNKKTKKSATTKAPSKGFGSVAVGTQTPGFSYSGSIRPFQQSPQRIVVDESIKLPDYALDGVPKKGTSSRLLPWVIEVKKSEEIEKMRASGKLTREILDMAGRMVKVGVTTDEIDAAVHKAMVAAGAYPSPLNYHDFPKSCCTSVNEVICHGIPDMRPLEAGDIINIDVTAYLDGYHGDCSEMFVVGEPDPEVRKLLQATYDCWIKACRYVSPGKEYKDLGGIIEDHVAPLGFSTVRSIYGHGLGSVFHTTPDILHYRNNENNGQMAVGHTLTIEPMICEGSANFMTWPDDWTITTVDGKRSAQFEHSLLVTTDGVEALTAKTENSMVHFWEIQSQVQKGFFIGTSSAARERADELNSMLGF